MAEEGLFEVGSYRLAEGRFYDRDTHLWVAATADGLARIGFDPLGSETSGDVVALSFEPPGTRLERGGVFGTIEAAKFVGPLTTPISGTILAHNGEAVADPALVNRRPLDCWLVELEPHGFAEETARMVSGRTAIGEWFAAEIERFRSRGMVAD